MLTSTLTAAEKKPWVLVEDGAPKAVIVLDQDPSPPARIAAKELAAHIREITGAELPIVDTKAPEARDAQTIRILVGESDLTRKYGFKSADFASQEQGIFFRDRDLLILGRDTDERGEDTYEKDGLWPGATLFSPMGTLYAAHTFLEKYCGVRWYFPGEIGLVHPKVSTLQVPSQDLRQKPWTTYRWSSRLNEPDPFDFYFGQAPGTYKPRVSSRKDMNLFLVRLKVGGDPFSVNHSYVSWYERFGATHPEWWANSEPKPGAHLDYLHPGVIAQTVEEAKEALEGKIPEEELEKRVIFSGGEYFAVMPLDNSHGWVRAPEAKKLIKPIPANQEDMIPSSRIFSDGFFRGWMSDYWFTVINRVASELRKTHPGAWVSTCAYAPYAMPPDFPLEPNVAVCVTGESVTSFRPQDIAFFRKLHQDWHKRVARLFVWEYYLTQSFSRFKHFPVIFPRHVAQGIRDLRADGVQGMFYESSGSPDMVANPAEQMLNRYMTWKCLVDDSLDPQRVLDEFYTGFFGPAAGPMKAFLEGIEERWETQATARPTRSALARSWRDLCPPEVLEALRKPMQKALAMKLEEPYATRVRLFHEAVFEPMEKNAQAYYGREEVERVLECPLVAKGPVVGEGADQAVWGRAPRTEAFRSTGYAELGFRTVASILRDKENLYFLVECEESEMDKIRATVTDHDNLNVAGDDDIEFFVDVGQTRQNYYHILINTLGTVCDRAVGLGYGNGGMDWESGVKVIIHKQKDGFIMEGSIPLKSFGVTPEDLRSGTQWGFNIGRRRNSPQAGMGVFSCWAPTYGGFNSPEDFGALKFVEEAGQK